MSLKKGMKRQIREASIYVGYCFSKICLKVDRGNILCSRHADEDSVGGDYAFSYEKSSKIDFCGSSEDQDLEIS